MFTHLPLRAPLRTTLRAICALAFAGTAPAQAALGPNGTHTTAAIGPRDASPTVTLSLPPAEARTCITHGYLAADGDLPVLPASIEKIISCYLPLPNKDKDGVDLLFVACQEENINLVRLLLHFYPGIDDLYTPFREVYEKKNKPCIALFLGLNPDFIAQHIFQLVGCEKRYHAFETYFITACKYGKLPLLEALTQKCMALLEANSVAAEENAIYNCCDQSYSLNLSPYCRYANIKDLQGHTLCMLNWSFSREYWKAHLLKMAEGMETEKSEAVAQVVRKLFSTCSAYVKARQKAEQKARQEAEYEEPMIRYYLSESLHSLPQPRDESPSPINQPSPPPVMPGR